MKYINSYLLFESISYDFNVEDNSIAKQADDLAKKCGLYISRDKELHAVAKEKNKVVGCVFINNAVNPFSFDFAVDEKFRKQGIGNELIKIALVEYNQFEEAHGQESYIEVDVISDESKNLLLKNGFEIQSSNNKRYIMTKYKKEEND